MWINVQKTSGLKTVRSQKWRFPIKQTKQHIYSSFCFGLQGNACPKPLSSRPTSCLYYLLRGASKCGMYRLYDYKGNSYPAYCDLTSEPGTAWTLVMSWSVAYRKLSPFFEYPFRYNYPVNENSLNWNLYRLNLVRTKSLKDHSTHWRATCSYPTHGVDFRDYLRGNFKDFNFEGEGHRVRRWNTSTSGDTGASISRHLSGKV